MKREGTPSGPRQTRVSIPWPCPFIHGTDQKIQPELTQGNLIRAMRLLFTVVDFLEENGIGYHLEGGTLLGLVRDGKLLPWDHDVDLSLSPKEAEAFFGVCNRLLIKRYKVSTSRFAKDMFALPQGGYRMFKIKPLAISVIQQCVPPLKRFCVDLDLFVKYSDGSKVYWQAKDKILCVDKKYYESHETIVGYGRSFRVPHLYREYLTQKYGDWSVPQRKWDCKKDEKTICGSAD